MLLPHILLNTSDLSATSPLKEEHEASPFSGLAAERFWAALNVKLHPVQATRRKKVP